MIETMGTTPSPSVLETNPHLAHYIFKLVQTNASLQPRTASTTTGQHPLSVSSSGESDDEDDADNQDTAHADGASSTSTDDEAKAPSASSVSSSTLAPNANGNRGPPPGPSREEREELVRKVIALLDNEQEEDVKDLLRDPMGELGKVCHAARPYMKRILVTPTDSQDEILMDQVCLDCMHRHRGRLVQPKAC